MSHLSKQPVDASMGASENHQRLCEKSSTESSHGHSQLQPSLLPQDTHSVKPQTLDTTTTKQPPIATNWTGTNDMDNPHNWSTWKRSYHIIIPALFGFAVTFGTSVYTPALPDIMRDFNVSRTLALLGLTVYTIGLALGPILTAPLSERYGRKIIYMVHSPIFMLFTLGAGFSKNFASLCVCRLLAGASGSPGLAVGAGTNADLFPPHQRAVTTSLFLMAPFAGPALGPVVGGFIAQYKSWQWTQWSMIFITLAITLAGLPMQETFKPVILARRAKKAGISLPVKPPRPLILHDMATRLTQPLHLLFTEVHAQLISLQLTNANSTPTLSSSSSPFTTPSPLAFSSFSSPPFL